MPGAANAVLDPPAADPTPAPSPETPPAAPAAPAAPTTPPEWLTGLPLSPERAALKEDKTLHRYKSLEDALAALPEQHKAIKEAQSGGALKKPGKDATPEQVKAYHRSIGVPEDVTGYADVRFPELADFTPDTKALDAFKPVALAAGYTPEHVQTAVNFMTEYQAQQRAEMVNGLIEKQQDEFPRRWGANESRELGIAARGAAWLMKGEPLVGEFFELLKVSAFAEHPGFILAMNRAGRHSPLVEDAVVPGHPQGALTKTEIQTKIDAMTRNKAHPFNNPGAPGHKEAMAEYERLLKTLHPETASA